MGLKNYRLNEKFRCLGGHRKRQILQELKLKQNFQHLFCYYYITVMLVLAFVQMCVSVSELI